MIMDSNDNKAFVEFKVCPHFSGSPFNVFESGFEQPIAQFDDMETAEKYALHVAEAKVNWKVDVYDGSGKLVGTYNNEDDVMPKPVTH